MENIDIIILTILVSVLYLGFGVTIYKSIKNSREEN
jgi:hypothetical protein